MPTCLLPQKVYKYLCKNGFFVIATTNVITKLGQTIILSGRINKKTILGPLHYVTGIDAFKSYLSPEDHSIKNWDYIGQ